AGGGADRPSLCERGRRRSAAARRGRAPAPGEGRAWPDDPRRRGERGRGPGSTRPPRPGLTGEGAARERRQLRGGAQPGGGAARPRVAGGEQTGGAPEGCRLAAFLIR